MGSDMTPSGSSDSLRCPRCGAPIEIYGPDGRIRAHQAPAEGRSCWAGGKLIGDIRGLIEAHHKRLQAAQRSAEGNG